MTYVSGGDTDTGEKEKQLLLSLCRVFLYNGKQDQQLSADLMGSGISRPVFLRLVRYHRLLPAVYHVLKNHPAVPAGFQNRLTKQYDAHKIMALGKAAETVRLARLFRAQGIDALCLKGLPLTLRLYNNLFDRHQGDIDFLGRKEDLEKVHSLLLEEGYVLQFPQQQEIFSSSMAKKAFTKADIHVNYIHQQRKVRVEFHFRLFKNPYFFPGSFQDLFGRKRTVSYEGMDLGALQREDEDMYLFAHGANHQWFRLKWLLDIAVLCRNSGTHWDGLIDKAVQLGLERTVAQGLALSQQLFASVLPPAWENIGVEKRCLSRLIGGAMQEIDKSIAVAGEDKRSKLPHFARKSYLTKLKKGFRYKLYHWRGLYYMEANRSVVKLPAVLFPLYYFLNPFLWFYRKFVKSREAGEI